jgi:hypothetical protein
VVRTARSKYFKAATIDSTTRVDAIDARACADDRAKAAGS